jgi:catechol 2,3-dioxygenase-like lactoylglutathione lyase family enzyme
MRRLTVVLVLLSPLAILAQGPAPERPSAVPTGLVVGSGNFFGPIVASLERAVAFYRDGLGLPAADSVSNADMNAPLRHLFGLPFDSAQGRAEAHLRWTVARPPSMTGGIEIVEISGASGRPLGRRVQDPGAFMLLVTVGDIDAAMQRMKTLGGIVVTRSGAPVTAGRTNKLRAVVIRDPDDHFVELLQPDPVPAGSVPGPSDARIRLTVDDLDRAVRLYRDALGFHQVSISAFTNDRTGMELLGLPEEGEYRYASLQVPGSNLSIELIEFRGMARQHVEGRIQDPGSTRLQLQVRDLDGAIRAVVDAGGAVVSSGGAPVELPAGRGATMRAAMVRDPNNLFLVLFVGN